MNYQLIDFAIVGDEQGLLIALEEHHHILFDIKRVYYIFGIEEDMQKGFVDHGV